MERRGPPAQAFQLVPIVGRDDRPPPEVSVSVRPVYHPGTPSYLAGTNWSTISHTSRQYAVPTTWGGQGCAPGSAAYSQVPLEYSAASDGFHMTRGAHPGPPLQYSTTSNNNHQVMYNAPAQPGPPLEYSAPPNNYRMIIYEVQAQPNIPPEYATAPNHYRIMRHAAAAQPDPPVGYSTVSNSYQATQEAPAQPNHPLGYYSTASNNHQTMHDAPAQRDAAMKYYPTGLGDFFQLMPRAPLEYSTASNNHQTVRNAPAQPDLQPSSGAPDFHQHISPGGAAEPLARSAYESRQDDDEYWYCDYDTCPRSRNSGQGLEPFARKDNYRDHLRLSHREPLPWRQPQDSRNWMIGKVVNEDWWRCRNCLNRNSARGDSDYICERCNVHLDRAVVEARENALQRVDAECTE